LGREGDSGLTGAVDDADRQVEEQVGNMRLARISADQEALE
jgi:hypothetical protein